jgi:hypothetical protein
VKHYVLLGVVSVTAGILWASPFIVDSCLLLLLVLVLLLLLLLLLLPLLLLPLLLLPLLLLLECAFADRDGLSRGLLGLQPEQQVPGSLEHGRHPVRHESSRPRLH